MKAAITLMGTGTSQGVPVIGCSCKVCKSADYRDKRLRTSAYISVDNNIHTWIDTGPDFRQQILRYGITKLDYIILTHEHKDHTSGVDDIRALNFLQNKGMPFYSWPRVLDQIRSDYGYIFNPHSYPGIPKILLRKIVNDKLIIGNNIAIDFISVLHHKLPVLGLRFGNMAYITDVNYISKKTIKNLTGIKILIIGALQLDPHLSHFTLEQALNISRLISPQRTIFTHLSHKIGLHAEWQATLPQGTELGYDGLTIDFEI